METGGSIRFEIQVAARDANTRKLVSQMGKRHKWIAVDISTNRALAYVATIVLRSLGVESNHQVLLYPDITVHTHLKYISISWGPTFDPTLLLKDIHKMFGAPDKLHFLYHLIAPEVFSPPAKALTDFSSRQHAEDDSAVHQQQQQQQPLKPRQLNFAASANRRPQQQQRLQPQHQQQQQQQQRLQSQQGALQDASVSSQDASRQAAAAQFLQFGQGQQLQQQQLMAHQQLQAWPVGQQQPQQQRVPAPPSQQPPTGMSSQHHSGHQSKHAGCHAGLAPECGWQHVQPALQGQHQDAYGSAPAQLAGQQLHLQQQQPQHGESMVHPAAQQQQSQQACQLELHAQCTRGAQPGQQQWQPSQQLNSTSGAGYVDSREPMTAHLQAATCTAAAAVAVPCASQQSSQQSNGLVQHQQHYGQFAAPVSITAQQRQQQHQPTVAGHHMLLDASSIRQQQAGHVSMVPDGQIAQQQISQQQYQQPGQQHNAPAEASRRQAALQQHGQLLQHGVMQQVQGVMDAVPVCHSAAGVVHLPAMNPSLQPATAAGGGTTDSSLGAAEDSNPATGAVNQPGQPAHMALHEPMPQLQQQQQQQVDQHRHQPQQNQPQQSEPRQGALPYSHPAGQPQQPPQQQQPQAAASATQAVVHLTMRTADGRIIELPMACNTKVGGLMLVNSCSQQQGQLAPLPLQQLLAALSGGQAGCSASNTAGTAEQAAVAAAPASQVAGSYKALDCTASGSRQQSEGAPAAPSHQADVSQTSFDYQRQQQQPVKQQRQHQHQAPGTLAHQHLQHEGNLSSLHIETPPLVPPVHSADQQQLQHHQQQQPVWHVQQHQQQTQLGVSHHVAGPQQLKPQCTQQVYSHAQASTGADYQQQQQQKKQNQQAVSAQTGSVQHDASTCNLPCPQQAIPHPLQPQVPPVPPQPGQHAHAAKFEQQQLQHQHPPQVQQQNRHQQQPMYGAGASRSYSGSQQGTASHSRSAGVANEGSAAAAVFVSTSQAHSNGNPGAPPAGANGPAAAAHVYAGMPQPGRQSHCSSARYGSQPMQGDAVGASSRLVGINAVKCNSPANCKPEVAAPAVHGDVGGSATRNWLESGHNHSQTTSPSAGMKHPKHLGSAGSSQQQSWDAGRGVLQPRQLNMQPLQPSGLHQIQFQPQLHRITEHQAVPVTFGTISIAATVGAPDGVAAAGTSSDGVTPVAGNGISPAGTENGNAQIGSPYDCDAISGALELQLEDHTLRDAEASIHYSGAAAEGSNSHAEAGAHVISPLCEQSEEQQGDSRQGVEGPGQASSHQVGQQQQHQDYQQQQQHGPLLSLQQHSRQLQDRQAEQCSQQQQRIVQQDAVQHSQQQHSVLQSQPDSQWQHSQQQASMQQCSLQEWHQHNDHQSSQHQGTEQQQQQQCSLQLYGHQRGQQEQQTQATSSLQVQQQEAHSHAAGDYQQQQLEPVQLQQSQAQLVAAQPQPPVFVVPAPEPSTGQLIACNERQFNNPLAGPLKGQDCAMQSKHNALATSRPRTVYRLPEGNQTALPSIICHSSSFAGTWHSSTGGWDSRTKQTPIKPHLFGGSIFSVAELMKQAEQSAAADAESAIRAPTPLKAADTNTSQRPTVSKRLAPFLELTTKKVNRVQEGQQLCQQQQLHTSLQQARSAADQAESQADTAADTGAVLIKLDQAMKEAEAVSAGAAAPGSSLGAGAASSTQAAQLATSAASASQNALGTTSGSAAVQQATSASQAAPGTYLPEQAAMPAPAAAAAAGNPAGLPGGQALPQQQQSATQGATNTEQPGNPGQVQQNSSHKACNAAGEAHCVGSTALAAIQQAGSTPATAGARVAPSSSTVMAQPAVEYSLLPGLAASDGGNSLFIDFSELEEVVDGRSLIALEQAQQKPQSAGAIATAAAIGGVASTIWGADLLDALRAAGALPSTVPTQAATTQTILKTAGNGAGSNVAKLLHVANTGSLAALTAIKAGGTAHLAPVAAEPAPISSVAALGVSAMEDMLGTSPNTTAAAVAAAAGTSPLDSAGSGSGRKRGRQPNYMPRRQRECRAPLNGRHDAAPTAAGQATVTLLVPAGGCRAPLAQQTKAYRGAAAGAGPTRHLKHVDRCLQRVAAISSMPPYGVPATATAVAAIKSGVQVLPGMGDVAGLGVGVKAAGTAGTAAPSTAGALQRITLPNGNVVFLAAQAAGVPATMQQQQPQLQVPPALSLQLPLLQQNTAANLLTGLQQLNGLAGDSKTAGKPATAVSGIATGQTLAGSAAMPASAQPVSPVTAAAGQTQSGAPAGAGDAVPGSQAIAASKGVAAAQLAERLHALQGTIAQGNALPTVASNNASKATQSGQPQSVAVSAANGSATAAATGVVTPGLFSPTGLLSPTGVGGKCSAAMDSLEALLADKDLSFLSPDKFGLNSSSFAGIMSCSASPTLLNSPVAANKKTAQQQQPPPQPGSAAVAAAGCGATTNANASGRGAGHATDFQVLYQAFRDGSNGRQPAADAAASKPPAPPQMQQQQQDGQVGELCEFLLGTGSDSWLVPPAAGQAPAAAAGGDGADGADGADADATVTAAGAGANKQDKSNAKGPAARPRTAAAGTGKEAIAPGPHAAAALPADGQVNGQQPKTINDRAKVAASNSAKNSQGYLADQAGKQQQQQSSSSGFNPNKPFAALFPTS